MQKRQAQAAVNADGSLEQTDRGAGDRKDQLVAEAAQQGHGARAGSLKGSEAVSAPQATSSNISSMAVSWG